MRAVRASATPRVPGAAPDRLPASNFFDRLDQPLPIRGRTPPELLRQRVWASLAPRQPRSRPPGLSNQPYLAAPVRDVRFRAEVRPSGVRFQAIPGRGVQWQSDAYRGDSIRGKVREFSPRSRSRLRVAAFDLSEFYAPDLLATLTYPGDWRTIAPDGPSCRRHMEAFRKRLTRFLAALGVTDWSALWFREFQRRGAPHFHLLLWGDGLSMLDLRQARRWMATAWAEVVAHPNPDEFAKHRRAGTGLEVMRTQSFAYAVAYANKPHQKQVPEGFASPGRWWGLWRASVPSPIVFSGDVPLPILERVVEALAASVAQHSPKFAAKLPQRFADVVGRGWAFGARVHGSQAASVMLGADLPPPQPPAPSGGPPRAEASLPLS